MKTLGSLTCLALAACGGQLANTAAAPPTAATVPVKSGHAPANGIQVYYQIHGEREGTPLVLLAGGGSTIEVTYGRILPFFAQHRRVIALDEQNHGRSGHRTIPERFTDSADDVAAVLQHLGVRQADIMGFSNGASVAMHVALRHPHLVRKLVYAASITKRSGAAPQFWEYIQNGSFETMPQPLKDAFLEVNPDEAQLRDMYEKDAERMRNFVETSDEEVKSLGVPTLIIAGDRDVPTPEHTLELSKLIPGARLMIVPGTHGEFLGELIQGKRGAREPEASAILIESFLDAKD